MQEWEIFEYLKNQRKAGNDKYFSIGDIEAYVREQGGNGISRVRKQVRRLCRFGYLEVKPLPLPDWKKYYRVRKQVLKRKYGGFLIGN